MSNRIRDAAFRHQRVQLFFSNADLSDAHASYLDGYHATCLVNWHDYLDIPVRSSVQASSATRSCS